MSDEPDINDPGAEWPHGRAENVRPEVVKLLRELRQMRSAIRAVVARHEAITTELTLLDEAVPRDDVDEDEEWLWTSLGNLCPLCGGDLDDGLREAESWELGVHEGNDFMYRQDEHNSWTVRRRWTITTELGQMTSGALMQFNIPDESADE